MLSACVATPSLSCGAAVKVLTHNAIVIIANQVYDSIITIDPNANFFIPFSLLCFGLPAFVVVKQAKFNLTIILLGTLVWAALAATSPNGSLFMYSFSPRGGSIGRDVF